MENGHTYVFENKIVDVDTRRVFEKLYLSDLDVDINIRFPKEQDENGNPIVFKAHKEVLISQMKKLGKIIKRKPGQTSSYDVNLYDLKPTAVKKALKLCYLGRVVVKQKRLHEFLYTAKALQMHMTRPGLLVEKLKLFQEGRLFSENIAISKYIGDVIDENKKLKRYRIPAPKEGDFLLGFCGQCKRFVFKKKQFDHKRYGCGNDIKETKLKPKVTMKVAGPASVNGVHSEPCLLALASPN